MTQLAQGLEKYTVQQLHLELIRRYKGETMSGGAIVDFLLDNPTLWISVIRDEIEVVSDPDRSERELPQLTKLGHLAHNWIVGKTLWLVVPNEASAHELYERGQQRGVWGKDVYGRQFVFDAYCSDRCLGGRDDEQRVMAIRLD